MSDGEGGLLRALGYVWTLPNTLLALLITVFCLPFGTRARMHTGVLEVDGGGVSWLLRKVPFFTGALAITLGHVVFARSREDQEMCRRHERVHVRQYAVWGPFFIPAYFIACLLAMMKGGHPYRENAFEARAYDEERDNLHA